MKIFARKDTKIKALCQDRGLSSVQLQELLRQRHGGDWVYVEDFKKSDDFLLFTDGMTYEGFSVDIDRYSDAVGNFQNKQHEAV